MNATKAGKLFVPAIKSVNISITANTAKLLTNSNNTPMREAKNMPMRDLRFMIVLPLFDGFDG